MEKELIINIATGVAGVMVGGVVSTLIFKNKKINLEEKKEEARGVIKKTEEEKERILEEVKNRTEKAKERLKEETRTHEERLKRMEQGLKYKEESLNKKQKRNEEIKLKTALEKEETSKLKEDIKKIEKKQTENLCEKTGIDTGKTKEEIVERYKKETEEEMKERLAGQEESIRENATKTARKILVNAIQRMCSPTSVETKVLLVKVPRDEIKGKIVGKDGKNILEFEKLLEVDIVFNDMPNTISISGYNLVNRRIAQKAIEKLVREKKTINTEILKESIKTAEKEIDKELYEAGERVVKMLEIKNLDKELIKTIGRLQYRTSYGQNIMKHSLEVSWIAAMLGSEVGINVNVCKIAGFLHDLGKAIDQDPNVQGTHDLLTKELMTKYGFAEEEIHAAWTHHDSEPPKTPEAIIVKAADAVSAGRPGARQESLEKYTERIKALEETGKSFEGIKKAYAISAGRELRVLVDPEQIQDEGMQEVAEKMAEKIEKEISYPGKIKINMIRRTGVTEIAK